jgi:hypothetical protein
MQNIICAHSFVETRSKMMMVIAIIIIGHEYILGTIHGRSAIREEGNERILVGKVDRSMCI